MEPFWKEWSLVDKITIPALLVIFVGAFTVSVSDTVKTYFELEAEETTMTVVETPNPEPMGYANFWDTLREIQIEYTNIWDELRAIKSRVDKVYASEGSGIEQAKLRAGLKDDMERIVEIGDKFGLMCSFNQYGCLTFLLRMEKELPLFSAVIATRDQGVKMRIGHFDDFHIHSGVVSISPSASSKEIAEFLIGETPNKN